MRADRQADRQSCRHADRSILHYWEQVKVINVQYKTQFDKAFNLLVVKFHYRTVLTSSN